MKLYSGGSPHNLDGSPARLLHKRGGLPPKAPTEQKPLIEDTPQGGDTLLDNSQKGLNEPLGSFPSSTSAYFTDGYAIDYFINEVISLDGIKNNSAVELYLSPDDPDIDPNSTPRDGVYIPNKCPILNDPKLIEKEQKEGIRQRFPRNDYCSKCSLDCPYANRIAEFRGWLEFSKSQTVIIEYQDELGDIKRKAVPKKHRFSKWYRKMVYAKLLDIVSYLIDRYDCMFFVTFTANPTWNLFDLFPKVSTQFQKVVNILKKRLNRKGIDLDFVKVYEPTEKGMIHVHTVFFLTKIPYDEEKGKVWLIDKKELDEIWGLGHTWLGWEENGKKMIWLPLKQNGERNVRKVLKYILKYLMKAHNILLFASLIWDRGRGGGLRSWTVSRRISSLMNQDDDDLPKTAVVVYFGYVYGVPDDLFPLYFGDKLIKSHKELEDELKGWWNDYG